LKSVIETAADTRTRRLTRSGKRNAASAAIAPPIEFPTTTTDSRSSSSQSRSSAAA
jgi:hypothetical protein